MQPGQIQATSSQPASRVVATSGPPLKAALELGAVTLREGQRLPTEADLKRSEKDLSRSRIGPFPAAPRWEITEQAALEWGLHRFQDSRGAASLGAIIGDEWGLFLSDLDCWYGMRQRGKPVPPLHEYLREGREDWGDLKPLILEALAQGEITPEEAPTAAREAGLWDLRDRALHALANEMLTPSELAALNVGDVDQDDYRLCVGGLWRELPGEALYPTDCYLDLRPELIEDEPLFLSQQGGRLSERQIQHALRQYERRARG